MIRSETGGTTAWEFAKAQWALLVKLYPDTGLMRMVNGVIALNTPELENDVKTWFSTHEVPSAGKQLEQALERQHIGVQLRVRELPNLLSVYGDTASRPDCVGAPEPVVAPAATEVQLEAVTIEAHGAAQGTVAPPRPADAGSGKA